MTETVGSGKADFHEIYNDVDARAYYTTLRSLDYEIPQHGADVVTSLIDARPWGDEQRPTVLDVCSSYGVGGVLIKTDLSLDEVYVHYQKAVDESLTTDQLVRADVELLARHRRPDAPRVIGLDVAENALRYAVATGALDDAFVENLEETEPSADLVRRMRDVDLITTTGGVGYVTANTFGRLVDAAEQPPWVAAFCLRTYDYRPIADTLAGHGLVTEKAERSFPQRRFADEAEQRWAVAEVAARDLDPATMESDGRYYADFYLSRPERDVARRPLAELIPPWRPDRSS
jgi:hypothetical protein